jgi:hypothetical protein
MGLAEIGFIKNERGAEIGVDAEILLYQIEAVLVLAKGATRDNRFCRPAIGLPGKSAVVASKTSPTWGSRRTLFRGQVI